MKKGNEKSEKTKLEILQDKRDHAKDSEIKKAQAEIDRYFMQDPPKQRKNKKKKRKISLDDFGYDGEFMDDEKNFIS